MHPQGGPPQNPFAYNVNTTYVPHDEVVPAVPTAGPSQQPPGYPGQQPHMSLQFTDTTAPQYVTGSINRQEERQNLVHSGGRSDDPGGNQPFGAPPPGAGPANAAAGGSSGEAAKDYTKYPFYNVRRYREYFDVDTKDVLWRVGNSLIGVFRPNFMEETMKRPDLYGPFWVATTLILISAVAGNFVSYIEWRKASTVSPPPPPAPSPPALVPSPSPLAAVAAGGARLLLASSSLNEDQWFTDYTKLATSAAIFYGYVFVVGLALYFCVKWFKGELKVVNVFCIYGYCLSIYIPVSIACVVPISWLQWVLVMTATALSAGFLFMNFRATIYSAAPARATLLLIIMVLVHIALGVGLKLYFFNY